jgi:hypothetical protein
LEQWYTLAHSEIGTHKMRFKDEMTKEKAISLGRKHCFEKGLTYVGTFLEEDIESEEKNLRDRLYV